MPPLKQIPLSEDQEKRLVAFIREGINDAEAARQGLLQDVRIWRRNYLLKPEQKIKTFPWIKSSNVVTQITPTHVDAIHARIKNTLSAFEDLWATRLNAGEGEAFLDPLRRYLRYVQDNEIEFDQNGGQVLLQTVKLGTCTAKCIYTVDKRPDKTYDVNGKVVKRDLLIKDGFDFRAIDFEDLLVPPSARHPQTAQWICHYFRRTWGELKWREHNGIFREAKLEEIKNNFHTMMSRRQNQAKEEKERDQGIQRLAQTDARYAEHDMAELWMFYDIDDDGYDEHIVVTYHLLSEKILRIVYNWNESGKRPFFRFRYWEQEDSYYGMGVAQMLQQSQYEIDMIHNQRNDNATIANMRAFKAKRGAGITPGTNIYPGKVFILDNPETDLVDFALGEVYPSSTNNEVIARDYAERRTGISDFNLGVEAKQIKRTPAATTLAVIQESNKRFDLVVRDIRATTKELGWYIVEQTAQEKPFEKIRRALGPKAGTVVTALLQLPYTEIQQRVIIDISATSAALNKETELQKIMTVFGLTTEYFQGIVGLAQMLIQSGLPPPFVQLATQMADVSKELVSRAFKLSDLLALAEKIPGLEVFGGALGQPSGPPGLGGGPGANGGAISPGAAGVAGGGPQGGVVEGNVPPG